jgi:hypothetical protein
MPKSKITTAQCNAAFAEVVELLGEEDSWHLNSEGGQYMVGKMLEEGGFKLIYKSLGPSSFLHCCEWMKNMLKAQQGISDEEPEDDDDDEEEDEAAALLAEEDDEEEPKKPAPAARASQKK